MSSSSSTKIVTNMNENTIVMKNKNMSAPPTALRDGKPSCLGNIIMHHPNKKTQDTTIITTPKRTKSPENPTFSTTINSMRRTPSQVVSPLSLLCQDNHDGDDNNDKNTDKRNHAVLLENNKRLHIGLQDTRDDGKKEYYHYYWTPQEEETMDEFLLRKKSKQQHSHILHRNNGANPLTTDRRPAKENYCTLLSSQAKPNMMIQSYTPASTTKEGSRDFSNNEFTKAQNHWKKHPTIPCHHNVDDNQELAVEELSHVCRALQELHFNHDNGCFRRDDDDCEQRDAPP